MVETNDSPEVEPSRIGRPRRFEPEVERRLLLDAGMELIARRGFTQTTVNEVLGEAGLSTRAFYRHFPTSQALVQAVVDREVGSAARYLEESTAKADGPIEAIDAWIDAHLDLIYEPRRAARAAVLTSPWVMDHLEDPPDIGGLYSKPLKQALIAGHRAGVLYSPSPEDDAETIHGLVWHSTGVYRRPRAKAPRAAAKAQVVRFAWPALGLPTARAYGSGG